MKVRILSKIKINPISLILLTIVVMGLMGIPFAYFFDKKGYFYHFAYKLTDENSILISYLYTLYGFIVMFFLYYGLGLKRKINTYINKETIRFTKKHYELLWHASFALAFICFTFVFIQAGGMHPALAALKSDYSGIKVLRHSISLMVNMNIYNIGFKFFLPFNLIVALFFLKKRLFTLISLLLFALMSTFVLEKGPIVSVIILIVFFGMLTSEIPFRKLFQYGLISMFLISVMYFLTRFATSISTLFKGISERIFYGQISDLPYYFELFSKDKAPFSTLLPPYLANLLGQGGIKSASRLVMEFSNPEAVSQGTAGVANTFFIGEAYAVAGHIGAILSPFIVMANLTLLVYLLSAWKKNIFFVFLYAWFLFKTFEGTFGGISYFTFSGLHIILLCLFYYLLSYTFVKHAKKRNNTAEKEILM